MVMTLTLRRLLIYIYILYNINSICTRKEQQHTMRMTTLQRRRILHAETAAAAVLLNFLLASFAVVAFTSPMVLVLVNPSEKRLRYLLSSRTVSLHAAAKKKSNSPMSILPLRNEFSRTIQPDRLLRHSSSSSATARGGGGGFRMTLQANETECLDLARRFDGGSGSVGLTSIAKLEASLTLRPESLGGNSVGLFGGVEAQGTVTATITQTCVRTNEKFNVNLEFPLYAIVRPAVAASHVVSNSYAAQEYGDDNANDAAAAAAEPVDYRSKSNSKKKKKKSYRSSGGNNEIMGDLLQLQRMMQEDISAEDDALVQDESIYPAGGNSFLDVGELVTQLFFLQIDPYPKKPGTSPVQRSISSTTSTSFG
jgi:hypothetical protein